ncbi:hypothetical protein FHL15_008556 [Xylaria flabelliformis]|uniref:C2H2-type domain-containing protein n=1 Tax=Xylaria flabelliformis TaxID=2512241 RepID=A0A553HRK5_9PEZI|nr:hypothetical protein FHL15_008556 [Xylaria flabelliformis]
MQDQVQHSATPSDATMASENNSARRNSRNGQFPCLDCGKILSRRDALVRHSRTAHASGSLFWCREAVCAQTNKGFKRFHDYRKHMRTVHNETVTPDNVPAQQAVLAHRHDAIGNGHHEALDQAAPQVIQQPVAQPVMHANFPYAPVATPQITPQFTGHVGPDFLAQTLPQAIRDTIPDTPRLRPAVPYVPDYYMYDGQPMFQKSDMQEPPRVFPSYLPVYVPDDHGGEIMFLKREGFQPSQVALNQPFVHYNQQPVVHHNQQPVAHHNQQPFVHHNQQPFVYHNQQPSVASVAEELVNRRIQNIASNYQADHDEQSQRRVTHVMHAESFTIEAVHLDYARLEEARRTFVRETATSKQGQESKGSGNSFK